MTCALQVTAADINLLSNRISCEIYLFLTQVIAMHVIACFSYLYVYCISVSFLF